MAARVARVGFPGPGCLPRVVRALYPPSHRTFYSLTVAQADGDADGPRGLHGAMPGGALGRRGGDLALSRAAEAASGALAGDRECPEEAGDRGRRAGGAVPRQRAGSQTCDGFTAPQSFLQRVSPGSLLF